MAGVRRNSLTSPEETVTAKVWELMKADEAVAPPNGAFRRFFEWTDAHDDGLEPVPAAMLPALKIEQEGEAGTGWISNEDHEELFRLQLIVFSPGWHRADYYGLLHLARKVFLSKTNRRALMSDASVETFSLTSGPAIRGGEREGNRYLKGALSFECRLWLRETA